jgi:hypothetical protein
MRYLSSFPNNNACRNKVKTWLQRQLLSMATEMLMITAPIPASLTSPSLQKQFTPMITSTKAEMWPRHCMCRLRSAITGIPIN